MADNKNNNHPFAFTPIILDQDKHEKRQIIKQLPAVHQTETLQKFFGATADHLFDPGKGRPINGYVGQKPLWYDPDQDYYLEEPTNDRTFYQLEAGMTSRNEEGNITDLLPYPDLINQLRFQGALTNNHNRLFSQDFYTWCPPIDLDKILNFRQYVWLPLDDVAPTSTFENGESDGWVLNDGSDAPVEGPYIGLTKYLGSFAGTPNGGQVVSKIFTLNPKVTHTTISFDFLKLNSWDAVPNIHVTPQAYGPESIFVWINDELAFQFTPVGIDGGGQSLGSGSFSVGNIVGSYSVTSPGFESQLDSDHVNPSQGPGVFLDRVYQISITLDGTEGSLKLGFGSNTDEPLLNESLGIDNVKVRQSSSSTVVLKGPTEETISPGNQTEYFLPGYGVGSDTTLQNYYDLNVLTQALIFVEVDGSTRPFTYVTGQNKLTFASSPAADAVVTISVYSDLENNAVGLPHADPKAFGGLQLSSNMRLTVQLDRNSDYNSADTYIVENVGKSIELIKEVDYGSSSQPDYIMMARGAANGNEWSRQNRWFHVSTLPDTMDPDYVLSRRATRPIIEFNRDLELYNYGLRRRLDVDIVVEDIEDINGYLNQNPTDITLNGIHMTIRGQYINLTAVDPTTGVTYGDVNSIRVLIRNTVNPLLNNNVSVLVNQGGAFKLILETDGENPTGLPVYGEVFKVKLGTYSGKNLHWDGTAWIVGQQKTARNQAPLFELYDLNGQSLRDEGLYPQSTFEGSKLFSYQVDTTGTRLADAVLGIPLVHDNKGQILFENYLSTQVYQYATGGKFFDIEGFYFHKVGNVDPLLEELSNDWYKAPGQTRQYMIDRYVADGRTRLYNFSQPAEELIVTLGRVNESKSFERTVLVEDVDFIRMDQTIMFLDIKVGDVIEIRSYSTSNPPANATGYYEVPLNLQANPDNDEVSVMTKGDFYDHFSEILRKQTGFQGAEYASNNYRDTAKVPFLGTHVIQHSAGLLKTMLLASNSQLDIMTAIRFAESEYARFKDKFQQKILSYETQNKFSSSVAIDTWINSALDELNKGKTKAFPFYLSGMAQSDVNKLPTFIPPTPSYLGVYPLYAPELISDEVSDGVDTATVWFVRGHDGSLTQGEDETCARVLFALEQRIFDSVPAAIRNRERPACDFLTAYSDQYRKNDYSYDEFLQILRPSFERWTVNYRLNSNENTILNEDDPWTWNWSTIPDSSGNKVPGHWRGIYEKFFGTQRPDLTPWEALGFSIKPAWWDNRYGGAPYTSDNLVLWNDIENGYIHEGDRQGINPALARPGLSAHIPVDLRGRLRHPGPRDLVALVEPTNDLLFLGQNQAESYYIDWEDTHDEGVLGCGICPQIPLRGDRGAEWHWGDLGPIEQSWRRSSNFAFAMAQASYLMKPAAFVELGWNTKDSVIFAKGTANEQWLNQDTKGRPRHSELQVHGEVLDDFSLVTKVGIQQWVSDLLASRNTEVNSNFANKVRGLGVQLNYKVGGFTDATTLVSVSDAFGRVPSEDVTISLYRSPSIREETYSGVAIEYTGNGYEIFGYDVMNPSFKVIPGAKTGNKISVGNGVTSSAIPSWRPNTYYQVNITVKNDNNFYRALKTHTSSSFFEPEYWTQVARPQYADGTALVWYLEPELNAQPVDIAYGTILKTPQEVADFLNGYGRYLESRGWVFEETNEDYDDVRDWKSALGSFIVWSNSEVREAGDYLTLSPCSTLVRFKSDHGTIQPIEQIINGLYAIVNERGQPIDSSVTRVVRSDSDVTIICDATNTGIFGLRLYISEVEHVLVFNNTTIFGDTIYSPLLNIKQPRLRIQGFKTVAWTGRIDAPGFIVTGDTLTPNFERAADDFRRFFEVESMENKKLQDRARANFGYEEREYLNNLLLTPTNQFEFYQGMIQQKGSPTAMRRLLRSNFVRHNKGLKLFEEWAFRVGDYGGQEVQPSLDIQIRQSEFKHNPQLIKFSNSSSEDEFNVINVVDTLNQDGSLDELDDRWYWRPDMPQIQWPLGTFTTNQSLPTTAGFVNLDEVRFTSAVNSWDFYGEQWDAGEEVLDRDRVWVYGIGAGNPQSSWATYKFNNTGYTVTNASMPTFQGQGAVVVLNQNVQISGSNYYLSQPLLLGQNDENGYPISGERFVLKDIINSDINPRMTYTPKMFNKVSTTLTSSSGTVNLMGFMPSAGQYVRKITVKVLEAFTSGSTLVIGHDENYEQFIQANVVDLTVADATYTFNSFPAYPWNTANAGSATQMVASLTTNNRVGSVQVDVDYYYIKGFELFEMIDDALIPSALNAPGGTASIYTWTKTRYPTVSAIPTASNLWDEGDIVEIDNNGSNLWSTYKRVGSSWVAFRTQNQRVRSDLLTNAAIFNSVENKQKMVLQLYDPLKGFIPGVADRELEYKRMTDPANYSNSRLSWGKEQVGQLWWDLSAVRYLDYEIYDGLSAEGGVNYRWKNWGRVAPGSTVDIYEWTRSPVAPNLWSTYVESKSSLKIDNKPTGTVEETAPYISAIEWNDEIQSEQTIYYFWVKNPTVVPSIPARKLSAQQVSNILINPSANDIPFFAAIDRNKIIIGGIRQFLNETDTILKVKWTKDTEIINNHHKQWMILREEDERNTINNVLWNKMRDSLVGWDATQASVPDARLPKAQQVGASIRPRQSWYPADISPNGGLRPSRSAREAFVDIMNDILAEQPFIDLWTGWENVFNTGEAEPAVDTYVATALDLADLANLLPASLNMVQLGERVLVQNTSEAAGFWTLWKLVEISGQRTFILDDFQKWRMQEGELWNLADWYSEGWSAKNFPNYRFATTSARDNYGNLDVTLLKGTLVQIDHTDTDSRWTWDVYTSTTKYQVAKAKSTMKLGDAFYDNSRVEFGPKQVAEILGTSEATRITPARIQELADVINYRDGSSEIEFMLNNFNEILFDTLQRNRLFFSMVKSAFKQTQAIDWAFKTSFLYLGGYSETLRQSPVAFKDQIDNVISYLEEVKPYHVKIREYVRRLSYGPDVADLAMTDFDKPVYPDGSINRVLNVNSPADQNIITSRRPWRDWYSSYLKDTKPLSHWDLDWNGVRRLTTKIKFDRISCGTTSGWDTAPWDSPLLVYSQIGSTSLSLSVLSERYRFTDTLGIPNFFRDQTVETISDRNYLVRNGLITSDRPGAIVTVLEDNSHYIWTGDQSTYPDFYRNIDGSYNLDRPYLPLVDHSLDDQWIKFEAIGWDQDPDMGAASRISQSYRPTVGMTRADDPNLIAGCAFDGTVVDNAFVNDMWDIFEWDSTGYSQGLAEHVGVDMDTMDGNTTQEIEDAPEYYETEGNKFSQPNRNGERPHELVNVRGINAVIFNVTRRDKADTLADFATQNAKRAIPDPVIVSINNKRAELGLDLLPTTYDPYVIGDYNSSISIEGSGLKGYVNAKSQYEEAQFDLSNPMTFVSWNKTDNTMVINTGGWNEDVNGFTPLHDPQNPSTGFIREVMLSKGYRSTSNVDMTTAGSKSFKLRDVVGLEIPAGLMGDNVKVAVVNTNDPTKRAIGVLPNTKSPEGQNNERDSWNGTIQITFTDGFVNLGTGKSWNIIPVDMFNEPGIVWVGNTRITYTELSVDGPMVTLGKVKLTDITLSSAITPDEPFPIERAMPNKTTPPGTQPGPLMVIQPTGTPYAGNQRTRFSIETLDLDPTLPVFDGSKQRQTT